MNNRTPSISPQRGKKKLNQNKKLFKKLFFLLLTTISLCNNSFSQEISIKMSSPVKNPIGYGDSILIDEIIIEEGEATNFSISTKHRINLKAPEGFKFCNIKFTPNTGGEVSVTESPTDLEKKPQEEIKFKFSASDKVKEDKIGLENIVLQPISPYNSNNVYKGKLEIKLEIRKEEQGQTIIEKEIVQEFPENGENYYMEIPNIAFPNPLDKGCLDMPYSFEISVENGNNSFNPDDSIIATYIHKDNADKNIEVLNEKGVTGTKVIKLDSLSENYKEIQVKIHHPKKEDWPVEKIISIGSDANSDIIRGNIEPIEFFEGKDVTVTVYVSDVPFSNFIKDAKSCTYTIIQGDEEHFNLDEKKFLTSIAPLGKYELEVSRVAKSGCVTKDTLNIQLIPDMITVKSKFCYGIDNTNKIEIAISSLESVIIGEGNIKFEELKIEGKKIDTVLQGGELINNFRVFTINPTQLLDKAYDSIKKEMALQIKLYASAKFKYTYNNRYYGVTNPKGYDKCWKVSSNPARYTCDNKHTGSHTRKINVGNKVVEIKLPKNNGEIRELKPVFCQGGEPIQLSSNNSIDTITIAEDKGYLTLDNTGRYNLMLDAFDKDKNTQVDITLKYYDDNTCPGDTTYTTTIHAVPQVKFATDVICEDKAQPFTQVSPDSGWVNIKGWSWDFGDGFTLTNYLDTSKVEIPNGTHGGNTTGKFKTPSHFYETPGKKVVSLEVMSKQGCKNSGTDTIIIGKYPSPTFTFSGKLQDRTTTLNNLSGLFPDDSVVSYAYNLTTPSGKESSHELTNRNDFTFEPEEYGVYTAELTARSGNGCTRSVDTLLPVFPIKEVSTDNFYFEDFTGTDLKGWLPSQSHLRGHEASWEHCAVKGSFKTGTQKEGDMWLAGKPADSIDNEISWLESPCFDLSELTFPMVSMDIFESLENGRDGAALFYTLDDGETWYRVGSTQTGANWYNGEGIFNTPGKTMGDNEGSMGWTKDTTAWVTARHPLDTIRRASLKGRAGCIRFRVAYNSNAFHNKKHEGFAVDNFLIGKRKRIILLEEFINSEYEKAHPNEIKTDFEQLNKFVNSYPDEICDIRYHIQTNYWDDPLLGINKQDNNVRAGHYGAFTWGAMWVMDGAIKSRYGDKVLNNNYQSSFEERGLVDPAFEIFNVQTELEGNKLKITATIKKVSAHLDKKYGKHASHVRYAIVQKEYKDRKGTVHRNVMIDLLPTAPGNVVKTLEGFAVGDEVTLTETWIPEINNIQTPGNKFRLIIFIEAHVKTKEIEQVWFTDLDDFIIPKTTRVKDNKYPESFWEIYPNPVSDKINLTYSQSLTGEIQWSVISMNGQKIKHGKSYINGKSISIPVSDLSGGLYLLQITRADGTLINKAFSKVKD